MPEPCINSGRDPTAGRPISSLHRCSPTAAGEGSGAQAIISSRRRRSINGAASEHLLCPRVAQSSAGRRQMGEVMGRRRSVSASFSLLPLILLSSFVLDPAAAAPRRLAALVQESPLVLSYHNGPLLKGNLTVNLLWYGRFYPSQHAIVVDFLRSLTPPEGSPLPLRPSVSSWWSTTEAYGGGHGATAVSVGRQVVDSSCSLGKSLRSADLIALARKAGPAGGAGSLAVVLTSEDVAVEGFCMSRCGTHGQRAPGAPYIWVGNPVSQCPGQCAWPFHQPLYGPQTPPLVAPNGDVGADGAVITLATLMAGTVTNPFGSGFFQGPREAPLEAVSACTGVFGTGAYPGYPGQLLTDPATGASFNARGVAGRRFLLPAMWDPRTTKCAALV